MVLATLGLASCSGASTTATTPAASSASDSGSSTAAVNAPPVSLAGTVNDHGTKDLSGSGTSADLSLEIDDNYFSPTFVRVAPGATVHVEIENEGTRQHTFTIDGTSVDTELSPGSKATVDVPVGSSGTVAFYCRFHHNGGMQGALFTGMPASGPGATPTTTTPPTTSSGAYGY